MYKIVIHFLKVNNSYTTSDAVLKYFGKIILFRKQQWGGVLMRELNYCSQLNGSVEKLDKLTGNLGKNVRSFTRFLVILCWYLLFNFLFVLVYKHPKSISLDTFRFLTDGIREIASQDVFVLISFYYQNKFNCMLLAAAFVAGVSFCVRFLYNGCDKVSNKSASRARSEETQQSIDFANVVSYKQHVAFLA